MGSTPSKPEFVTVLADHEVKLGKVVILRCRANTEELTATWEKDGSRLKLVEGKHIIKNTGTSFVLEIRNAGEEDEGSYTIHLKNISGSLSCTATVTVELNEWRTVQWNQITNTQNAFIINNQKVSQLRFLVYGLIGAGKSSIINTLKTIFEKRISMDCGTTFTSHTLKYEKHQFADAQGGPLPFVFIDVMGVEIGEHKGVHNDDIFSALKGHIKEGYEFNPVNPLTEDSPHYRRNPSLKDRIHCLVTVIPADKLPLIKDDDGGDDGFIKKFKKIGEKASTMGIFQVVFMTRVDLICPLTNKDLHNVYKSKKIKDTVQKCSELLGVPMNCIFPVCNYHRQTDINEKINCLMLHALNLTVRWTDEHIVKTYEG